MQSVKTTLNEPLKESSKAPRLTINSNYLNAIQRRVALATVVIPFLGALVAIGLLWYTGRIGVLEIGLLAFMYTTTMLGITVGYHRLFAHRAFKAKPAVRVCLAVIGAMAAQGPVIHWVSNHRRHHSHSDQPGDPHSPHLHDGGIRGQLQGFWYAHIGWLFHSKMTNSLAFSKDLLQDTVISKVNKLYFLWLFMGLALPAVLGGLISWTWVGALNGLLWGGFVRIFLAHHATWSINSITHIYGRSPFDTHDYSTNNFWLALPTMGEAWHNNHHAFPASAIFGLERLQIDVGAWTIRALERLGWAWEVKAPTAQRIAEKKAKSLAS
jgi:stearoyl-CoA desaturase (Delta-9 desaturase)